MYIFPRRQKSALTAIMAVAGLLGAGLAPGSAAAEAAAVHGAASAASTSPVIRGAGSPAAIAGKYIVVLSDAASDQAEKTAARAQALADKYNAKLGYIYESLHGFSITTNEDTALNLAADPDVAYVEQAQTVQAAATQNNPTWGLDRIDQRTRDENGVYSGTYSYDNTASNVTAYVIDSGMRISHNEFEGRASYGWDFVDDDAVADDCTGHGTHVAGTIGGKTYGVAKRLRLVSLRVIGCNNLGTTPDMLEAVEWVTANAVKPAVVNMSLGWACTDVTVPCLINSSVVNAAITNSINSGITWVIAAGNEDMNACDGVGAIGITVGQAIAVGSTDAFDHRAPNSNWGPCVKIFAPGVGIESASMAGPTATSVWSGTSMATPHVVGAVALILGRTGWATKTPAEVLAELIRMSTKDAVVGIDGTGTPNRLLFTEPPPVVGSSSIAVARHHDGRLALFGVGKAGELFTRTQNAPGASSMSSWLKAEKAGWNSVSAETDADGNIELVGLRKTLQDVYHRTQAVPDANSWYSWSQFDGTITASAVARTSTGVLELFGINSQGTVLHRSQSSAGSSQWSAWAPLNFGGQEMRSVAAELNANGNIEVFAVTSTGEIWHRWQTSPTAWSSWVQLDGTLASIAVARNGDGRLELFGVTGGGDVYRRTAAAGTNNWFSWSQLDGAATSLAAETNADGRVALYAVNKAGLVWQRSQTSPGSDTYTSWIQIDGELRP